MSKLFKLFGFLESSKEINVKGIGLGLHISKKIVKMFNGEIICRSQANEGANFVFIVALGKQSGNIAESENKRILNPIQKQYPKLIVEQTFEQLKGFEE